MHFGGLFPGRGGGVLSLFENRRVRYSFNTRVAIRAAVDMLGLKPGDEVLAPAYNCGSELDPLLAAGLRVRLYPVNADTTVDPDRVAPLIGPRSRAIYLTHYFGFLQPAAAALRSLADARGLWLMEDCALSLLSGVSPAEGRTGHVAFFCFYKFFPVLGGGALVVNDPDLPLPDFERPAPGKTVAKALVREGLKRLVGPDALLRLRRQSRARAAETGAGEARAVPDVPAHYYFDRQLAGRRMSVLTARALAGLTATDSIRCRRSNYLQLLEQTRGADGLEPLRPGVPETAVPLSMPLRVTGAGAAATRHRRDAMVARLKSDGIEATAWWSGYNRNLDFSDTELADLSSARKLKDSVLSVPVHQYLGPQDIDRLARSLRDVAKL